MSTKDSPEKVRRITLVHSPIGYSKRHKGTIRALGLRRLHQTVEHVDSPTLRGMLYKVAHLVEVWPELTIIQDQRAKILVDPPGPYRLGVNVTITARPIDQTVWRFDHWRFTECKVDNKDYSPENPLTLTLKGDMVVEAMYVDIIKEKEMAYIKHTEEVRRRKNR